MSSLIIQRAKVSQVQKHPNADALEIVIVNGWQLVSGIGNWHEGDEAIYVPPDSVLPLELSDKLEVTKYLSNGRIRVAKLRGEPSYGLLIPITDNLKSIPDDQLASVLGITKYEPPVKFTAADAVESPVWFHKMTDIENMRHFPELFSGHDVLITEKIDGTAFRVGYFGGEFYAGSKNYARAKGGTYWSPLEDENFARLLTEMSDWYEGARIMVFGEIYGKGIQKLQYGAKGHNYAIYDISINGKFIAPHALEYWTTEQKVPAVPPLYVGRFDLRMVKELSKGETTIGGNHIKEGVVVRTLTEMEFPQIGRGILKYVSDDYLLGKKDDTTDS